MKKPNLDKENKLSFNKVEILIMVVLVLLVAISATLVVTITTRNRNVANFKTDSEYILSAAKNAYNAFEITNKTSNIVVGSDGVTKGMCITVKGLQANGYLTDKFNDYEGYVVVEEEAGKKLYYTIWVTNKKYVINGYDSKMVKDLTIKKGIEKYNKDEFTSKVRTSFVGTTKEKGGTGVDSKNLKRYEAACINEKVE